MKLMDCILFMVCYGSISGILGENGITVCEITRYIEQQTKLSLLQQLKDYDFATIIKSALDQYYYLEINNVNQTP